MAMSSKPKYDPNDLPEYPPWEIPAFYLTGQRHPPAWLEASKHAITLVEFRLEGQRGKPRLVYAPGIRRDAQEVRALLEQQAGCPVLGVRLLLVRYRDGQIEEIAPPE
jgi:hypothetical protein